MITFVPTIGQFFAKLVAEREYQQIEMPLPCMSGLINVKILRRSIKASKLDVSVKKMQDSVHYYLFINRIFYTICTC